MNVHYLVCVGKIHLIIYLSLSLACSNPPHLLESVTQQAQRTCKHSTINLFKNIYITLIFIHSTFKTVLSK